MGEWGLIANHVSFGTLGDYNSPRVKFEAEYIGYDIEGARRKMEDYIVQLNYLECGLTQQTSSAPNIRKKIKKVIFNDPATIILWQTGEKTVVKCGEYEDYDPEKGFAMAIAKYVFGNQGNYYEIFKKWLPEEEKEETITRSFNDIINDVKDDLNSMFSQFMNPPEEEKTDEHD